RRAGYSCRQLARQRAPGTAAGVPAVLPDGETVDHDQRDAGSGLGGIGKARAVPHRFRVEDDEIGEGAGSHDAAVAEAEPARREAGHPPHRLLEAEEPDLAAIVAEDAG